MFPVAVETYEANKNNLCKVVLLVQYDSTFSRDNQMCNNNVAVRPAASWSHVDMTKRETRRTASTVQPAQSLQKTV